SRPPRATRRFSGSSRPRTRQSRHRRVSTRSSRSSEGGQMKASRVIALVIAAVAWSASSPSFAEDKVSLRLNWYLGGLHVPFYYGKDKGYYAAEGIDLTINEGRGSANTVQVVAAGSDTFGLADSSS